MYKGQLAWSFNYSCKSRLLFQALSDCHVTVARVMGKKCYVHFYTSHLQNYGNHGNHGNITFAESWKKCHVHFLIRHICRVMGKWNNRASILWLATEGKMKSHLWTNWSGMKSLYLCLCLYYYLYLYFQEGGGNFVF